VFPFSAGTDEYDKLRQLSFVDADAFVLCFSVADRHSFHKIKAKWVFLLSLLSLPYCLIDPRSQLSFWKQLARPTQPTLTV